MYKIDSKVDKPDIAYMEKFAEKLMEKGIKLSNLSEAYENVLKTKIELANDMLKKYGITNANSSAQIISYLKGMENVEVYEACCINEKWSSNKEAMSELADMGYEFALDLLEYRKAKKYTESIKSLIDSADSNNLIHPTVSLSKTNRINYSKPALMNIPKDILWNVVIPREENNTLFSVDIKNQEPSIMINLLNIAELKDSITNPKGLYETLFEKVFEVNTTLNVFITANEKKRIVNSHEMYDTTIPPVYYTPIKPPVSSTYFNGEKIRLIEVCNTVTTINDYPLMPETVSIETTVGNVYSAKIEWDKINDNKLQTLGIISVSGKIVDENLEIRCEGIERKEFKRSWNAMTYGASITGIKKMCKAIDGDRVYRYFSKIKPIKEYKDNCIKLAKSGVQRINTMFKTQLFANEANEMFLRRVLMDLPIQGTGADILSMLIKHFNSEVKARGIESEASIYYTRHDELIISVANSLIDKNKESGVINILRDILEHKIDDWTPFKVEIKKVEAEEILTDNDNEDIFE